MTTRAKILESNNFLFDITKEIEKAKTRVYILAMVIAHDDVTNDFIEACKRAASRNVEVILVADIFTYTELSGFIFTNPWANDRSRKTTSMVKELRRAGVTFKWIGLDHISMIIGRTHTKMAIVDDTCYTFGGVNFYDGGIDSVDYMIKMTDKFLAKQLCEELGAITRADGNSLLYRSRAIDFNDDKILIDGGMLGGSMIYARAKYHAKNSKHITFVSQYCPTGSLARAIKKVPNDMYFNPLKNTNFINGAIIAFGKLTSGFSTQYRKSKYLHAKFIIFTKNDGTKVAITGSHNFIFTTVLAGTREIALETTDKNIIKQLEQFVVNELI